MSADEERRRKASERLIDNAPENTQFAREQLQSAIQLGIEINDDFLRGLAFSGVDALFNDNPVMGLVVRMGGTDELTAKKGSIEMGVAHYKAIYEIMMKEG